jgi:hypothetical protein
MDNTLVSVFHFKHQQEPETAEGTALAVFEHLNCSHGCSVAIPIGNWNDIGAPMSILVTMQEFERDEYVKFIDGPVI